MFETFLMGIGFVLALLLIPYTVWQLWQIVNSRVNRDTVASRNNRQSLSTQNTSQHDIPQANILATRSQSKSVNNPPYPESAGTIETANQASVVDNQNPVIEAPVQVFVEDHTPKVDDPIIDNQYIDPETPSADTLDAHIGESDSSPYGVRSADHSPGRRLRDKRYRRNSS